MNKVLCEFQDKISADLLVSYLNSLGIHSFIQGNDMVAGHMSVSFNTVVQVLVNEGQFEEASKALKDYEK